MPHKHAPHAVDRIAMLVLGCVGIFALQLAHGADRKKDRNPESKEQTEAFLIAGWIAQLPAENLAISEHAREALIKAGVRAVPKLIDALGSLPERGRLGAAVVLRRIGRNAKDAIPALLKALHDNSEDVRRQAAFALGTMEGDAVVAVPELGAMLNSKLYVAAAVALGQIGRPSVSVLSEAASRQFLGSELTEPDRTFVRWEALKALGKIATPETLPVLALALRDSESSTRMLAAKALAQNGAEAVPAIVEALRDQEGYVRSAACHAVGFLGRHAVTSVTVMIETMKDKESLVRRDAAEAIGKIGPEANAAAAVLIEALNDSYKPVRLQAAQALVQVDPKARNAAIHTLQVAVGDAEENIRQEAAFALAKIDRQAAEIALPVLSEALQNEKEWSVRDMAASALVRIGPASVPSLLDCLKHPDGFFRKLAVSCLMDIGPGAQAAVGALADALDDREPEVRERAAKALRRIGAPAKAAIPSLKRSLNDESVFVRNAAREALGAIQGKP